jgi:hypothetical protein
VHFAPTADLSISSSDLMRDAPLERMTEVDRSRHLNRAFAVSGVKAFLEVCG